jgi:hypothetical protein
MIVINDDLTSHIVIDDGTLECFLPNYNPETLVPFQDKDQVSQFISTIYGNPNYWLPYKTPEEHKQIVDEANAKLNKAKAVGLLQQTDWASIADIADPTVSNPYLSNRSEFLSYRSTVRNIAVNPTPDAVFPVEPQAVWVTV